MGASGGPGSSGQQCVLAGALLLHFRRVSKKVRGISCRGRIVGDPMFRVPCFGSCWGYGVRGSLLVFRAPCFMLEYYARVRWISVAHEM